MKIQYVADVITPADKAGKVGEVKELEQKTAEWLVANGYAEPAEQEAANNEADSDNAKKKESSNDGGGGSGNADGNGSS